MTTKISSDNIQTSTLNVLGSPKITNVAAGSTTAVLPAGGQTVTVTGTGFQANAVIYVNNTNVSANVANSTSLTFTTPVQTVGSYQLSVYNTDGTVAIRPGGLIYFDAPVWSTSAGALPNAPINLVYNTTITATGGTISYSITSGSLPTGLSLNSSSGVISGTPTVQNDFNFTVTATNQYNQTTARAFSISVTNVTPTVEYLVVAGGASGAIAPNISCGGGGAGGAIDGNVSITSGDVFTVTVGGGGTPNNSDPKRGYNGSNSVLSRSGGPTLTAIGGGTGGYYNANQGYVNASSGGSGGGGSWNGSNFTTFGTGTVGQGNNGGAGSDYTAAGGGGGAGAAGGNASGSATGGVGGIGIDWKSMGTYYAGGGGGAGQNAQSAGGLGGGGSGGKASSVDVNIMNGSTNTGGGGGGATYAQAPTWSAGLGGSGVVLIRYPDTYAAASTTGSPTITVTGGYRIYKFTGSGSITF